MSTAAEPVPESVSRPLWLLAGACLAVLGASLMLMVVDPRQLMGASVWLKPVKFAASIAMTAATLALLLRHVHLPATGGRRAVVTIALMGALEQVIITLQAARGVPSHFNATSAVNGALFTIMGIGITVMTIAVGYVAWFSFRQRFSDAALGWGIRLGFAIMLAGSAVGAVMPRPTAAQVETMRAGRPTPLVGAHAVGVPDGGPGLPITRWSTEGGDLRVPHFIGLHALQILPLAGAWMGRRGRRSVAAAARAARLTVIGGVGYAGLVAVTFVQALRGQPLLAPDGATAAAAIAGALGCLIAGAVVAVRTRHDPSRDVRSTGAGRSRLQPVGAA
jgi:hypothetical protein